MNPYIVSVTVTTASDGSATAYTDAVKGRVLAVRYAKTDYADGVDATITGETGAVPILTVTNMNASAVYRPRPPVQDEAAADATLDGTRKMREPVVLVDSRIKIVLASGGDTKTGTFYFTIG